MVGSKMAEVVESAAVISDNFCLFPCIESPLKIH